MERKHGWPNIIMLTRLSMLEKHLPNHGALHVQAHGLSEVYTGGLSSYSVIWTIMAHLLQEGFLVANPLACAGLVPHQPLPPYHLLPQLPYSPAQDLGALLYGYMLRYSQQFSCKTEAVSVLQACPPLGRG